MDPLYIVDLDVTAAEADQAARNSPPSAAFDRLVGHVAAWLEADAPEPFTAEMLQRPGTAAHQLRRAGGLVERRLSWSRAGTEDIKVFQCTSIQDLTGPADANFICEVTVYRDPDRTALRIEMGRQTVGGLLTPASVSYLRRPRLLVSVLRDPALLCRAEGQVVDGRFTWINAPEAEALREALDATRRLPLLLIDGRRPAVQSFGRQAASHLAGLAQVVLVGGSAVVQLRDQLEELEAAIPDGGARLVWPASGLRSPDFADWQLRHEERAISTLLKMVATASVAARGQNPYLRRAVDAARRQREAAFEHGLAEARAAGDASSEVAALTGRVAELREESEFYADAAQRLEDEVTELRAAKSEAQYWKAQALAAQQAAASPAGTSWQDAPDLDPSDLTGLAEFLTKASDGAIVFTPAAVRGWKQSVYPHVERMGEALGVLARAAVEWRQSECQTGGMVIDDWFKIRWDLNMAGTDKGLRHVKGQRFTFEGADLSREPHLKLDDHVKPNEVGRVYFATDTANKRFVVDHVGTKLY